MNHTVVSGAVAVVAIAAAVIVQVLSGADPAPYIGIASAAAGYATGNAVAENRNRKS